MSLLRGKKRVKKHGGVCGGGDGGNIHVLSEEVGNSLKLRCIRNLVCSDRIIMHRRQTPVFTEDKSSQSNLN